MSPLASRSTNSPNKRPRAIITCKMHKTTQAPGNFKNCCILQTAACKEGVPRRKAAQWASSPSIVRGISLLWYYLVCAVLNLTYYPMEQPLTWLYA